MADFRETIQARIRSAEERKARAEADRESANREIESASLEIERLRTAGEVFDELTTTVGDAAREVRFAGMTIADASEIVMRSRGGTARLTDVRDELAAAGKLKGQPQSMYGTLIQTFKRHEDRFEQVAPGVWRIAGVLPRENGDRDTEADETYVGGASVNGAH